MEFKMSKSDESLMEKDYRLVRNAVIYSLLPVWMKLVMFFGLISLCLTALRLYLTDAAACTAGMNYHHGANPVLKLFLSVWDLVKDVVVYGWTGC